MMVTGVIGHPSAEIRWDIRPLSDFGDHRFGFVMPEPTFDRGGGESPR